jgi:hypothetical protein
MKPARQQGTIRKINLLETMMAAYSVAQLRGNSMYYFVLNGALEPDVKHFAKRRCPRGGYVVYRDGDGSAVVGFRDGDRAELFLNLFDGEIERAFDAPARKAA